MKSIEIVVSNKIATAPDDAVIVCGNDDYVVTFLFDEDWDGYEAKTARFTYVKNGKIKRHDEPFVGNVCPVPVLSNISRVDIGVYAGDLKTTTAAVVKCKKSILCNGGVPDEPDKNVYGEIMELFNTKLIDPNTPVDQVFDAASENPQSGKAVAQAIVGGVVDQVFDPESKNPQSGEALADVVIKTLTGRVNIWELETGIYYIKGYVSFGSHEVACVNKKHIFIVFKINENAVRYLHFCGGLASTDWGSIGCGFTNGTMDSKNYNLVDTSKVANEISKHMPMPQGLTTAQAVMNYVGEVIGGIENGSY